MAKPIEHKTCNRDSNRRPYNTRPTPSVLASCYTVSASTMALKGFHYSSTGAGGTSLSDSFLTASPFESLSENLTLAEILTRIALIGAEWCP